MTAGRPRPLDASVLVLNKHYLALKIVSARRAFCLLVKDLAEVVTIEDDRFASFTFAEWCLASNDRLRVSCPDRDVVRAVRFELEVPRIIRVLGFDRLPTQRLRYSRRNVFARDGNRCQYCGKRCSGAELSLDHVVPRSRGGPATWENIVCACRACNVRKGGRTPQEAEMTLIRPPSRPPVNPALRSKLMEHRYRCWRPFLERSPWAMPPG